MSHYRPDSSWADDLRADMRAAEWEEAAQQRREFAMKHSDYLQYLASGAPFKTFADWLAAN